jgi:type VI secretion system secreted protein VgrG
VAKDDAQISVAHTLSNVSGKTTSLYTHSGGIQTIAANGPISLQAHTDKLEVLADKSVTITSVNDEIEILASQKVRLVAANAEVVLEGGNIAFKCPNTWSVKGSSHAFTGPASDAASLAALPTGTATSDVASLAALLTGTATTGPAPKHDEQFQLLDPSGRPLANIRYKIVTASGATVKGVTDSSGKTQRVETPAAEKLQIYLMG